MEIKVVAISPSLIKPRAELMKTAFIVPSAARLIWDRAQTENTGGKK